MTKLAIVGAGAVGSTLGAQLQKAGYEVKYGVREPGGAKGAKALSDNPGATVASVADAVAWSDVVILATPAPHDDDGLRALAASLGNVDDKVILDATNPTAPKSEGHQARWGGLSGAEVIQAALPNAKVFKAWNTIGVKGMAYPDGSEMAGERLTMLFAGSDEGSLEFVRKVVADSGFQPVYVGPLRYARNLEIIAELWIHLAVLQVGDPVGFNFHLQFVKGK